MLEATRWVVRMMMKMTEVLRRCVIPNGLELLQMVVWGLGGNFLS